MTTREDGWVLVDLAPAAAWRWEGDATAKLGWMDPNPLPVDANGHAWFPNPGTDWDYCIGCGYPKWAPEASARCDDADGLAEESAERVKYVAEHRVEVAA